MSRVFPGLLILFFLGCSGRNDVPSGIIPRDKMEKILWDLVQADQYYREYIARDSSNKNVKAERYKLYEQIFQMYKISRSTFEGSFDYYSQHPSLMKDVFDSLSVKGNRRMQDLYKPANPVNDSALLKGKSSKPFKDSTVVK